MSVKFSFINFESDTDTFYSDYLIKLGYEKVSDPPEADFLFCGNKNSAFSLAPYKNIAKIFITEKNKYYFPPNDILKQGEFILACLPNSDITSVFKNLETVWLPPAMVHFDIVDLQSRKFGIKKKFCFCVKGDNFALKASKDEAELVKFITKNYKKVDTATTDLSEYKYAICFESSYAEGNVSEKILQCFQSGVIPIYAGDPNICTYFDAKAIILANPAAQGWMKKVVDQIKVLEDSPKKYNEMIRTEPCLNYEIFNRNKFNKLLYQKISTCSKIPKNELAAAKIQTLQNDTIKVFPATGTKNETVQNASSSTSGTPVLAPNQINPVSADGIPIWKGVKYVMCILNCKKYAFKRQAQLETWIPDLPKYIHYFHIIGIPDLPTQQKYDFKEHILYVKVADNYESLAIKMYLTFEFIDKVMKANLGIVGCFKTDDDIQTNVGALCRILHTSQRLDYAGLVMINNGHSTYGYDVVENRAALPPNGHVMNTSYFCQGSAYYVSRKSIEIISKSGAAYDGIMHEDIACSLALKNKVQVNSVNIQSSDTYREAMYVFNRYLPKHQKYYKEWDLVKKVYPKMLLSHSANFPAAKYSEIKNMMSEEQFIAKFPVVTSDAYAIFVPDSVMKAKLENYYKKFNVGVKVFELKTLSQDEINLKILGEQIKGYLYTNQARIDKFKLLEKLVQNSSYSYGDLSSCFYICAKDFKIPFAPLKL